MSLRVVFVWLFWILHTKRHCRRCNEDDSPAYLEVQTIEIYTTIFNVNKQPNTQKSLEKCRENNLCILFPETLLIFQICWNDAIFVYRSTLNLAFRIIMSSRSSCFVLSLFLSISLSFSFSLALSLFWSSHKQRRNNELKLI